MACSGLICPLTPTLGKRLPGSTMTNNVPIRYPLILELVGLLRPLPSLLRHFNVHDEWWFPWNPEIG